MGSRLIMHWSEYDQAVQEILDLSPTRLEIFDEDLSALKLETAPRVAALRALLVAPSHHRHLRIVVRKREFVCQYSPHLMNLLQLYAPLLTIIHAPPQLDRLDDCLMIADDRHTLVRFHRDQPRARLIVDDAGECAPYCQRFAEVLGEGGDALGSTTLGL
ncbi:hypothetical protein [Accumulibacter sp.]|uniref:DUF7931 domain-containing protein n=1 Tax=Accumulibacter sp. TaxID=2053492 RepID=UPI0025F9EB0B|nr:hypothetical protein [Accumulibacter sp.]MCM8610898.1 hypothetical protein [Accumulibacter sp.]MCM8634718.1 hypothetical protein [Accumulibacter sp.]MCM8638272.1 hypothetical protein [Accumulibacter sp.]